MYFARISIVCVNDLHNICSCRHAHINYGVRKRVSNLRKIEDVNTVYSVHGRSRNNYIRLRMS